MRAARFIDTYLPITGSQAISWDSVFQQNGLCNVPASWFLRPYSPRLKLLESLRIRRITQSIRQAAMQKKIIHLWWHPHNFGIYRKENLAVLRAILNEFAFCQQKYDMQSMSMAEVAYEGTKNGIKDNNK
jgi:hypothetical protein